MIKAVLETGPAPSPREQQMLDLLEQWRAEGSSRLDRDLDGTIDAPGAAIMDRAGRKIADAVMSPVLGPQLGELASLITRDNRPTTRAPRTEAAGTATSTRTCGGCWPAVPGTFKTQFCGAGNLACAVTRSGRRSRRRATSWPRRRARTTRPNGDGRDSGADQVPAEFPITMRWTNRPTFQQVISYSGTGKP